MPQIRLEPSNPRTLEPFFYHRFHRFPGHSIPLSLDPSTPLLINRQGRQERQGSEQDVRSFALEWTLGFGAWSLTANCHLQTGHWRLRRACPLPSSVLSLYPFISRSLDPFSALGHWSTRALSLASHISHLTSYILHLTSSLRPPPFWLLALAFWLLTSLCVLASSI